MQKTQGRLYQTISAVERMAQLSTGARLFVGMLLVVLCYRMVISDAPSNSIRQTFLTGSSSSSTAQNNEKTEYSTVKTDIDEVVLTHSGGVPISALVKATTTSRSCTTEQAKRQLDLLFRQVVSINGCAGRFDLLQYVQLARPRARVFMEIGANRAYFSAGVLQLWYPELGLSVSSLSRAHRRLQLHKDLTSCGSCKECKSVINQLFPTAQQTICSLDEKERASCVEKLQGVKLFSFDGNNRFIEGVRKARDLLLVDDNPITAKSLWTIELAAFTEHYSPGKTVQFIQGNAAELLVGRVIVDDAENNRTSEEQLVPLVNIDHIAERESLQSIDVLKIDAGGHDPIVLRGARQTLEAHKALVVIIDYHETWPRSTESLKKSLDDVFAEDYACYLAAEHHLLVKLTHGCWTPQLEIRKWSNVWCVSLRASGGVEIAQRFDQMTSAFA